MPTPEETEARRAELHARVETAGETLAALEESNHVQLAKIQEQFKELSKLTARAVDIDADLKEIRHGMTSLRTVFAILMDDTDPGTKP